MKIQIRAMQAIRSRVAATVRRDWKEPVESPTQSREESVIFRWRRFLLLTYLVVTASTAQLCLMTQDEIRKRKSREAQEIRERLRPTDQDTKQNVGKNCGKKLPARVIGEWDPSKRPPTEGWPVRVSDCPHVIESRAFQEKAHLEWMTCLSCGARWSPTTGPDDIQMKEGSGCDTAPLDASMSRMWKSDALSTNLTQEGDVLRLQSISPMQKSGACTTYYGITCFTVCALVFGRATSRDSSNGHGCRIS